MIGPRLPFLLPWVRVHPLIRSIRAKTWNDATWPTVKVMLGRALDMRRRINREGWWSYTALVAPSAPPSAFSSSHPARTSCSSASLARHVGWLGIVTGAPVFVAALTVPLDDRALLLALAVLLRTGWLVFDGDNTTALVCQRKAPP